MLARMADLKERVAAKLAEMRRFLERSGGQVDLVEVEDGIAKLRVALTRPGPSRLVASLQLKSGVERALRSDIPEFRPGDTVRVHVNIVEGNRSRIQVFQGAVIRRQGGGLRETFTVRKVSFGVGVERTFPVHTPVIEKIEVVTRGDVRRAKLYYLRELRGKKAKIKEKRETVAR